MWPLATPLDPTGPDTARLIALLFPGISPGGGLGNKPLYSHAGETLASIVLGGEEGVETRRLPNLWPIHLRFLAGEGEWPEAVPETPPWARMEGAWLTAPYSRGILSPKMCHL